MNDICSLRKLLAQLDKKKWKSLDIKFLLNLKSSGISLFRMGSLFNISSNAARKTLTRYDYNYIQSNKSIFIENLFNYLRDLPVTEKSDSLKLNSNLLEMFGH